jgi:hypothetical protein
MEPPTELILLTRRERLLAGRAYFSNRVNLLIQRKELLSKRQKPSLAILMEQLRLF